MELSLQLPVKMIVLQNCLKMPENGSNGWVVQKLIMLNIGKVLPLLRKLVPKKYSKRKPHQRHQQKYQLYRYLKLK